MLIGNILVGSDQVQHKTSYPLRTWPLLLDCLLAWRRTNLLPDRVLGEGGAVL